MQCVSRLNTSACMCMKHFKKIGNFIASDNLNEELQLKGCEFWKQGPLQYGSAQVAYNIMTNSPKCYRLHLIKAYVTPHMNLSRLGKRPLQYCSAYVMYQYHVIQVLQGSATACTISSILKTSTSAWPLSISNVQYHGDKLIIHHWNADKSLAEVL